MKDATEGEQGFSKLHLCSGKTLQSDFSFCTAINHISFLSVSSETESVRLGYTI